MRTLIRLLAFAVCCAPIVHAQTSPALVVAVPSATVAELDTLVGVAGTPFAAGGRRSGTTTIVWSTSPAGVLAVIPTDDHAQTVSLAAVARGAAYVIATWRRSDGLVLRDSQPVAVGAPRAVLIAPANVWTPNGPVFDVGLPFTCVTPVAFDRLHRPVLGIPVSWSTADTALATRINSSDCPNRTVDPATLPIRP